MQRGDYMRQVNDIPAIASTPEMQSYYDDPVCHPHIYIYI